MSAPERTKRWSVRIEDEDWGRLTTIAEAEGWKVGTAIRWILAAALRTPAGRGRVARAKTRLAERRRLGPEYLELARQVTRAGVNLNQIARKLNETADPDAEMLAVLREIEGHLAGLLVRR